MNLSQLALGKRRGHTLEDSTGKRFSHLQITLNLNLKRFREGSFLPVLNII